MKGITLAGGSGWRLYPLTKVTNKHLLPVGKYPMIFHAIAKLPNRYGVPELSGDRIISIEEKPSEPKSQYAVTGIYMYDAEVFDVVRQLPPSARGELEITNVNNAYIAAGTLSYDILQGWWTDAGTYDSLMRANELAQDVRLGQEFGKLKL